MFLTGQHVPLMNYQMVIIKHFELRRKLLLIIKQKIQYLLLLNQKFPRPELRYFLPDGLTETPGEELSQRNVLL